MDEIGDSLLMILILLNQENTIALFRKKEKLCTRHLQVLVQSKKKRTEVTLKEYIPKPT